MQIGCASPQKDAHPIFQVQEGVSVAEYDGSVQLYGREPMLFT